MQAAQRMVLNTTIQYIRTAIYMILTIVATRYILQALGQSDFGIYSVIGSIVMMLGFMISALAGTTQRFLSVSHGKSDIEELRIIFSNSIFIHACIAAGLALIMIALSPLIMSYLNIPEGRLQAGTFVYYTITLIIALTFITSPIKALFIARENIIFVSVVDIADAILRLAGAIALLYIPLDSLKLYAALMASLSIFNFAAFAIYAGLYYPECHVPRFYEIKRHYLHSITHFAVWNIYSTGATILRTQGLAVIINRFLGTIINASYGIALQMNNAVNFVASSILNSINPQLMKAEGEGNRNRMWQLAEVECKYSFIVMAVLLIPVIVEMPAILYVWLGAYPDYAVEFCRCLLITLIIDQSTIGLTSANQAIGQIKVYALITGTLRLSILFFTWLYLRTGNSPHRVLWIYTIIEAITAGFRIPYMKYKSQLDVAHFLRAVHLKAILPICICASISFAAVYFIAVFKGRFLLTMALGSFSGGITTYFLALTGDERDWINSNIKKLLHR